ncbi:MAG: putative Ig domain-containing protein [Lachnospiraceae bacterium]|nr:putative Ig domain-containing protein [Lachnospiraceae bacterium]
MSIVSPAAQNEWKLTLKDDGTIPGLNGHVGFNASRTGGAADPVQPGDQITITYGGAKNGGNEYVSVILKDASGNILYYGHLANDSESGTDVPLTIPADIPAGTYTLDVFAEQCNSGTQTDYASNVVTGISLTVAGVITTNLLPDGTAGTAYNQTLTSNIPASAMPVWSITNGTLPPGLSLSSSTGAITGTPTAAGTYDFTVNVTVGTNTATKTLSITIAQGSTPTPTPPPTPTPTPSGGSGSNVYSIWYEVIKGHGQTWAKGSGVPLAFTAKRSAEDDKTFSLFRGVEIDGATLDQAHYTATAGSVHLSLSAVYLETLSEGTHTIRILFTDGHAEGRFLVQAAPAPAAVAAPANMTRVTPPQTSDANVPVIFGFGSLLLLALAGLCAVVWRGKRAR